MAVSPTRTMTNSPPSSSGMTGRNTSNTTTSGHSGSAGTTPEGDEGVDSGDGDSSVSDDSGSSNDEADVKALSGVAQLSMEPSWHLAGNTASGELNGAVGFIDDDVDMSDSMQATPGAEDLQSDINLNDDDDDYTALAALSDDGMSAASEELLRDAEQDLVEEYMRQPGNVLDQTDPVTQHLFDPHAYEENTLGMGSLFSMNDDPFEGAQLFGSQWQEMANSAELDLWRMPNVDRAREDSMHSNSRPKRVRFQETVARSRSPSQSSSDSSEDEADGQFPDIFMDQEDPKIKQLLSGDLADGDWNGYGSDTGSVYDFEDDADRFAFEVDEDSESSEYDSDSDSSDESDEGGYDTEEETPEERQAIMEKMRNAMRPISTASAPATPTGGKKRPTIRMARSNSTGKTSASKFSKGPRKGTFACDPTKATIMSDSTGKKTVLYMPTQPEAKHKAFWDRARNNVDSRDSSPRGSMSITMPSHGNKEDAAARPFTAQSTLSTMFGGNFDFMHSPDVTPAPSTRSLPQPPFTPVPSSFASVATTDEASDAEDEFTDINMLINFDHDSDTEEARSPALANSPTEPTFLSRGIVGSFRLNQVRAKQESSLALHPADRASTSELNALQTGRRGAGNAPITPARKKRVSKDMSKTASGIRKPAAPAALSSPLAARRRSRGQSLNGRLDQTLSQDFPIWKR